MRIFHSLHASATAYTLDVVRQLKMIIENGGDKDRFKIKIEE